MAKILLISIHLILIIGTSIANNDSQPVKAPNLTAVKAEVKVDKPALDKKDVREDPAVAKAKEAVVKAVDAAVQPRVGAVQAKDAVDLAAGKTVKGNVTNEVDDDVPDEGWEFENQTHIDTRRILYGKKSSKGKRPYMVYLQLTKESSKAKKYKGWLCGGVIVHPSYVLTSAACVEDADHFYVVAGTTKYVDSSNYKSNDCVCKHRRRVVWKCIPKNYKFDFQDSVKWSSNDIAVVKVDKPFKLGMCESGCEFPADLVCYNNISRELEKPNTKAWIMGWGTMGNFREGVYRRNSDPPKNSKCLQEAKVCIMDNEQCAKKWAAKFRDIICQYMICTKDVMKRLSEICEKKYANCTDIERSRRDFVNVDDNHLDGVDVAVDLGRHIRDPDDYTARRSSKQGGFCENDHGGPLIVKYQGKERVIGVISACKIDPKSHSCHGPFLYTSVFKNRQFISCAINKETEDNCRRVFRSGITHEEWTLNWDGVTEDTNTEGGGNKADDDDSDDNKDKKDDDDDDDSDENSLRTAKDLQSNATTVNAAAVSSPAPGNGSTIPSNKPKRKAMAYHNEETDRKDMSYMSSRDENVNDPPDESDN